MSSLTALLIIVIVVLVLRNNSLRVQNRKVSGQAKAANDDKEKLKDELNKVIEELKHENKALLRIMKS